MRRHLTKLAVLFALFAPLAFAQQYTLGQTTLSGAITSGATQIQLASVTGINGYTPNLQPIPSTNTSPRSHLYIDREEVEVRSVTGTVAQVTRGVNGTVGSAHVSGQMVLSGPANAFFTYDPGGTPGSPGGAISGVSCTSTAVYVTPYVNVRTGAQWLCSTITGTYVPGFNNLAGQAANTTLVADAAGAVLPSGPLFEMGGGTTAVTGFTIPVGCNATAYGGCQFTVIPTTAWTWTTAGNIATSGTAVAKLAITFRWDATTSKFTVQQSK